MADTTFIKKEVEQATIDWLTKRYPDHQFEKRCVQIGVRSDGKPAVHEFDAVSGETQSSRIVVGIKSHSGKTASGKHPAGKVASIYQELYFLNLCPAKIKLLVLTDEELYRDFLRQSDGKVVPSIEIVLCPLPDAIRLKLKEVQQNASKEQLPR